MTAAIQSAQTPQLPDLAAIILIALSTMIMAFSNLFDVILIFVFLLLWLPLSFYKRKFALKPSGDVLLLLSLPLLCCISALWSDNSGKTLYHALQFGAMITCAILFARLTSKNAMIIGIGLGTLCVLLITLASQNYARDYFSDDTILVGYFGSKNIVGFFASIGCLAGVLSLFLKTSFIGKALYSMPVILVSFGCLILSHSASSLIATGAMFGLLIFLYIISKMPAPYRWTGTFLASLGAVAIIVSAFAFELNVTENILAALGRDTTLTGRTFLWQQGIEQIRQHFIGGFGYRGFWLPGNNDAEYLWEIFGITGKDGFHFHNLFIQIGVDLGILGILLMTILVFSSALYACASFLRYGASVETAFLAGLAIMFLIRTVVEVDILGPFGMGSFLFYMILPRAVAYGRRKARLVNS